MGFIVEYDSDGVIVALSGLDRFLNLKRRVRVGRAEIERVSIAPRDQLELLIDHRVSGIGDHNGARNPGKRRVGTMLGRESIGHQFWAVSSGDPELPLLVLDLEGDPFDPGFQRIVLEVDDPEAMKASLDQAVS